MKNFKELDKRDYSVVEGEIRDSWGSINEICERQIKNRNNNDYFVFYDGPAFANGFPGLHHMVAKNLKDAICKYKVMKGYKVIRKVGWDTHGLPVENHVEKKLGISSKKEIEALGIDKFNQECRNSVRENEAAFTDLTRKMGQFIDVENPYLTYKNEYIETEWWILKKFYEENMFYEGTRVVPYCPHCGTGLATHEVAQDYQTLSTPMKLLEADLKTGNIVNYNQNPLDIYCLKNTACSIDKFARIMPKKTLDNANKRIDGAVTMIMCYVMLDRYKKEFMDFVNR